MTSETVLFVLKEKMKRVHPKSERVIEFEPKEIKITTKNGITYSATYHITVKELKDMWFVLVE